MTTRPQAGSSAAYFVQLLQSLSTAPALSYLKDATHALTLLQTVFTAAQRQPVAGSPPGILQAG